MKVEDVMTKDLVFIDPDASVKDAIDMMLKERIRSLLIKPRNEKDTHGVITVRDIVFEVIANEINPEEVRVYDIASKPVVTVRRGTDLKTVIRFMKRFNIARVFVIENGEIVGIVTLMDIMKAYDVL
ncbi:MAG: histidine kinase [Archaeoglobales archaeon]|nr:MAG: histidine kinase [Archaeoglobales archaeon]